jgi:hypothetical protein
MGYSTDFDGEFKLDKPLTEAQVAYLTKFAETRRMKRNAELTAKRPDPLREAVGLPVGTEGEYFVNEGGVAGQGHMFNPDRRENERDVVSYNDSPSTQPGLWCQWIPTEGGEAIIWDFGEKFYNYVEWLEYIIENFIDPWGYKMNGTVYWHGEDTDDIGSIIVVDNVVDVRNGYISYGDESPMDDPAQRCLKALLDHLKDQEQENEFLDNIYDEEWKTDDKDEQREGRDEIIHALSQGDAAGALAIINEYINDPQHVFIDMLRAEMILDTH